MSDLSKFLHIDINLAKYASEHILGTEVGDRIYTALSGILKGDNLTTIAYSEAEPILIKELGPVLGPAVLTAIQTGKVGPDLLLEVAKFIAGQGFVNNALHGLETIKELGDILLAGDPSLKNDFDSVVNDIEAAATV